MINESTVFLNGKVIKYLDVIHHHTDMHFDFMDRLRILFRGKARTYSQIYTGEICNVRGSTATVYVEPIIKRKPKVMGLEMSSNVLNPEVSDTTGDAQRFEDGNQNSTKNSEVQK